jgi:hypothetical protein
MMKSIDAPESRVGMRIYTEPRREGREKEGRKRTIREIHRKRTAQLAHHPRYHPLVHAPRAPRQQAEHGVHGEYEGERAEAVHGDAAGAEVADDATPEKRLHNGVGDAAETEDEADIEWPTGLINPGQVMRKGMRGTSLLEAEAAEGDGSGVHLQLHK